MSVCLPPPHSGRLWGITWRTKMIKRCSYYMQKWPKSHTAMKKGLYWTGWPYFWASVPVRVDALELKCVCLFTSGFSALRPVCTCWAAAGRGSWRSWRRRVARSRRLSHVHSSGSATVSRRCSNSIWRGRCVGVCDNTTLQDLEFYILPMAARYTDIHVSLFRDSSKKQVVCWSTCLLLCFTMKCKAALHFTAGQYPVFVTAKPCWGSYCSCHCFLSALMPLMSLFSESDNWLTQTLT